MSENCMVTPKLRGQERGKLCDLAACDKVRGPYRRRWCSDECDRTFHDIYYKNHLWSWASAAVFVRDGRKCVQCGSGEKLEVNHKNPLEDNREASYAKMGCWHHMDGLELLCHKCHVIITNDQRRSRMRKEYDRQQVLRARSGPGPTLFEIHALVEDALKNMQT